jgi:hypothetical protein
MTGLRGEMQATEGRLTAIIAQSQLTMTRWFVGSFLAGGGLIVAAIKYIP